MTSPASSGPAGSLFEGQVGAYYLLSLLAGGEPRGLPGTTISRVEFQRAGEGRHLDDVIVHAQDAQGVSAALEIQVKRSITFSPGDVVFKDVVKQIAAASLRPDFNSSRYELAIATAKNSNKIDGPYQDVLTWAREIEDAATFHARIQRPGSGNNDMRNFIDTFRTHLRNNDAAHDDQAVWALLRRLQIFVFDFTAVGSASEALAKERALNVLHADESARAGNLWTTLNALSLKIAANGGDRTRDSLLKDLQNESFRFAGDRRFYSARASLSEASRKALDDMWNRIGDVTLTRHERVATVRTACDEGRYIEIRGVAGVGKSGVLRHFAEQKATETQVIVLSPGRTTPKGWLAMRAILGFNGTAHELLSDLASDGGGILFIDNLDLFGEEERLTVIDLVREAVNVPGFSIIATARLDFGIDEPSWLPSDVLDKLGKATPVIIDELSESEIEELSEALPKLKVLLAKDHPAREVACNLYRLARIASQPSADPVPRTEIDMAEQWWNSADGKVTGRRERARVIRMLAEEALNNVNIVDVSTHPPEPIEALIASGTLRDLGNDRMTFRHDVLREWAIANLLFTDETMIERLSFNRPASASLARGVELAARMMLERATDGAKWHSFLTTLSRDGFHGSWRRAALLALVRSEIGADLLSRTSSYLLDEDAKLLRELIRTMKAVDVEPIAERLAIFGLDPAKIKANFDVPRGAAWSRLITWLLLLGNDLPAVAIPDVVDVYTAWSAGTLGYDPITPYLLQWLYSWLTKIENSREVDWRNRCEPFDGKLSRNELPSLESALRTGFLLFCNHTPELAAKYLQSLMQHKHNDEAIRSTLKLRGSLARAAPRELAEFTVEALIQIEDEEEPEYRRSYRFEGAFGFIDNEFLPASPNQGPFLELLNTAPEQGLPLIRRLVDHAISFRSKGTLPGNNIMTICLPNGEQAFPWTQTYMWSREKGTSPYIVKSALMALESWAHKRIEAGEGFDKVLGDVIGKDAPACYLLVAVDLLLSHWPKSCDALIPFLACPELLCIDLQRQIHDGFEYPDIFGIKGLQVEPNGLSSVSDLKARTSRRVRLEEVIGNYAVCETEESRNTLTALLKLAIERLGAPDSTSDLGDPRFMVVHAMNLADPANWPDTAITLEDGSQKIVRQYVPPQSEVDHLKPMQEAQQELMVDANMQTSLSVVIDNPGRSSPEFAESALIWAQTAINRKDDKDDEKRMREEAVFIAAMVAARDGNIELKRKHEAWIRNTLTLALKTKNDPCHWLRSGLRYNPVAVAFVGMILLLKDGVSSEDIRMLLEIAARENPAAAHGFAVEASTLAAIDERLIRAVLRCALSARIQPSRGEWDEPEKNKLVRTQRYQERVKAAIDAEITWLDGKASEPDWPKFPVKFVRPKRRLRIPGGKKQYIVEPVAEPSVPDEDVDHKGAALWIRSFAGLYDIVKRPWLRDIVSTYSVWTMTANGAELEPCDDVDQKPGEWNNAYFNLLVYCLPTLNSAEVDALALTPITSLPDESFFDVIAVFTRSVDNVYFNNQGLQEEQALHMRSTFVNRMMDSLGWDRLASNRSYNIEIHIAPALAVLFFNDYAMRESRCYLLQNGMDRLAPFLPELQKLVVGGPCLFMAIITLNLIEVLPKTAYLPFVVSAGKSWLLGYPNDSTFWIDHGIGRRLCAYISTVIDLDKNAYIENPALRQEIQNLLAGLVSAGVAEAYRLEESLSVLR